MKVTINMEVEVENSVSINEFKEMLEILAEHIADQLREREDVIEVEVKKVRVVL